MTITRFYQLLFSFFAFLGLLIAEYFACEMDYRLTRLADPWILIVVSTFLSLTLCYFSFRKAVPLAIRDGIPRWVVLVFLILFALLFGFFFRFSLQLVNGALDPSSSENHRVVVTDKALSAFGGSVAEGINPIAHLVYYKDWDPNGHICVLLAPQDFYYSVDVGSAFQVTIRQGLFHWPWVESYQLLNNPNRP